MTDRSANTLTSVVSVSLSLAALGSSVLDDAVAVLVSVVPFATLESTFTTTVNIAASAAFSFARVAVTVPLPPTAGVVRVQPDGAVALTKVVPAGSGSVICKLCAWFGPLLFKMIVYVRLLPGATGSALSDFATLRSASGEMSVAAVAPLFAPSGSKVAEVAFAVLKMVVVGGVSSSTFTTSVNVA